MSVSRTHAQRCPICRAFQPLEATRCSNCGAALNGVPVNTAGIPLAASAAHSGKRRKRIVQQPLDAPPTIAWEEGEADLHEAVLPHLSLRAITFAIAVVMVVGIASVLIGMQAGVISFDPTATPLPTDTPTQVPTIGVAVKGTQPTPPPTNTKAPVVEVKPTLDLPTITPAPPTPTVTPTRGPCTQKVAKGDTLYGLAAKCGHKHLGIVDTIIKDNALKDASSLQEGQTIIIPWPTPTGGAPDENAGGAATPGANGTAGSASANNAEALPPGIQWYTVHKNDTAISVAFTFHMTMKDLRDLNPEIQFLQCDFSFPTGGPSCTLRPLLGEGQKVRVAAPKPTPTLSPTFSGSETATPTGTATFNALYSQSPDDNMLYESSELPALRWVASAQLDPTQTYLITVTDLTAGVTHYGTTRDLAFQIPLDWQPTDGNPHKFKWVVAVASKSDSGTPVPSTLTTDTRTFTWHSR